MASTSVWLPDETLDVCLATCASYCVVLQTLLYQLASQPTRHHKVEKRVLVNG